MKTVTETKILAIRRYDLLGNEADGFDNNDTLLIANEILPDNYGNNKIQSIVNPYFIGRGFALAENSDHIIEAKDLHYIWEADDYISIEYRGQAVGELIIEDKE